MGSRGNGYGGGGALHSSSVVKMKGLPFNATERDVRDFFADLRVKRIAFVMESDRRPSGMAFVDFVNTEEASKALARNGDYIGSRYVKLLRVPVQEMESQVGPTKEAPMPAAAPAANGGHAASGQAPAPARQESAPPATNPWARPAPATAPVQASAPAPQPTPAPATAAAAAPVPAPEPQVARPAPSIISQGFRPSPASAPAPDADALAAQLPSDLGQVWSAFGGLGLGLGAAADAPLPAPDLGMGIGYGTSLFSINPGDSRGGTPAPLADAGSPWHHGAGGDGGVGSPTHHGHPHGHVHGHDSLHGGVFGAGPSPLRSAAAGREQGHLAWGAPPPLPDMGIHPEASAPGSFLGAAPGPMHGGLAGRGPAGGMSAALGGVGLGVGVGGGGAPGMARGDRVLPSVGQSPWGAPGLSLPASLPGLGEVDAGVGGGAGLGLANGVGRGVEGGPPAVSVGSLSPAQGASGAASPGMAVPGAGGAGHARGASADAGEGGAGSGSGAPAKPSSWAAVASASPAWKDVAGRGGTAGAGGRANGPRVATEGGAREREGAGGDGSSPTSKGSGGAAAQVVTVATVTRERAKGAARAAGGAGGGSSGGGGGGGGASSAGSGGAAGGGAPPHKAAGGNSKARAQVVRADGSTIKMRGLPFRASTEEVVSFFKGFHVLPDSLHLGVDNLGRPSGEGWITFTSQEEAKKAFKERNRQYLGQRYIELTLC